MPFQHSANIAHLHNYSVPVSTQIEGTPIGKPRFQNMCNHIGRYMGFFAVVV